MNGTSNFTFVRDGMTKTLKARVPALTSPFAKLCIYYGFPSLVRHTGQDAPSSVQEAVNCLLSYDVVILGAGLEETTHPDHANTVQIVQALTQAGVVVFGYTDTQSTMSLAAIDSSLDNWKNVV